MVYTIQLTNKKTGEKIVFDDQQDYNNGEKLYYKFLIDGRNIADGEYDLEITDHGQLVMADTLYVGDFNRNSLQYKRGENTYIEIVLDAKIQDKEVEISEVNTVISADDDFDGMKTVTVDAQPLYDIAFEQGNQIGYETGKQVQKELLESVTITENGTYSTEDGYNEVIVNVPDLNGDYNEGFTAGFNEGLQEGVNNAGGIIAETAQVLNITENGNYTTAFSKEEDLPKPDLITGYLEDGTPFYDYGKVNDGVFDTGIQVSKNSRLEFWWSDNGTHTGDGYQNVLSCQATTSSNDLFQLSFAKAGTDKKSIINLDIVKFQIQAPLISENGWYHFIISPDEGFIINDVKYGDIDTSQLSGINEHSTFIINGTYARPFRRTNGSYGVIKIDDIIIIPTEDGFLNTKTNTYLVCLDISTGGNGNPINTSKNNYTFNTNDITPILEGNLIRTVNVNITPKINIKKENLKFGYSSFVNIPEWADFTGVIDYGNMFEYCSNLTTIPQIDTSLATNFKGMCFNCSKLRNIELIDTSNVTSMEECFNGCGALITIPPLITSNVKNMSKLFAGCTSINNIPPLDASNLSTGSYGLFSFTELPKLTDFGGLINLKYDLNRTYSFDKTPNLSYQSCINILNGLYDFTGNGETPNNNQGKLKVHQNFLNTVGDEISIGTSKGWTITA